MSWLLVIALCLLGIGAVAQPAPQLKLTQLSPREWVDLSKVSFVRTPVYIASDPACYPNCQVRWGADFIVDGVSISYTEEAEATLRRLLGIAP